MRDHRSHSREQGHEGLHAQPGRDRPQGLYACHEMPERALRGHSLGGVIPKGYRRNSAMHSILPQDQSDTALGSESETEVEEWDDIVAYCRGGK